MSTSLERMKKILGSPLGSRKKSATQQQQYFGTPLDTLLRREDGRIPHLVSKICDYVLTNGAFLTIRCACVRSCLVFGSLRFILLLLLSGVRMTSVPTLMSLGPFCSSY